MPHPDPPFPDDDDDRLLADLSYLTSSSGPLKERGARVGMDPACDYVGMDLSELDLRGQDLSGINFSFANFDGTNLTGSDLTGCTFDRASFVGTIRDAATEEAPGAEDAGPLDEGPRCLIGVFGHDGHGKTTLTAAIAKVLAESGMFVSSRFQAPEPSGGTAPPNAGRLAMRTEYATGRRRYVQMDWPAHADATADILRGAAELDGAILVVSAADGPMPQTRYHILLARQLGVPAIVVFMNEVDRVDDPELLDLVELEVRELLSSYQFAGDEIPVVKGSVLCALEDRDPEIGRDAILTLIEAVDRYIPQPERAKDRPFLMSITDVVTAGRTGTVVVGRVERGTVTVGDTVDIVGLKPTAKARVIGVERARQQLNKGEAGEEIAVALVGVGSEDVECGQVLAEPGSVVPHTRFTAAAYMLTKEEGGRHTPFSNDYRPQFFFRSTDVTGVVTLPEGLETVMPGDKVAMDVELVAPVVISGGLHFEIREGDRIVGTGVVVAVNG